jgi:hypothetical protein
MLLSVLLLVANESSQLGGSGTNTSANRNAVELVDWSWNKDPSFGGRGTIKWNVQVRNISSKYIASVRVEFTSYDSAGKLIATISTYVHAIPPGQTGSADSFADLYKTEAKAAVRIAEVRFAQ